MGEIYTIVLFLLYFTLTNLTLPFFLVCLYRPEGSTDLHAQRLKRCGLGQGFAFFENGVDKKLHLGVENPQNSQVYH
jgi:hypothetical protein